MTRRGKYGGRARGRLAVDREARRYRGDRGVIAVGQGVGAGPRLAIAVDGHRLYNAKPKGGERDRVHARPGNVELDGIVRAESTRRLGGDVGVANSAAGVDCEYGFQQRHGSIAGVLVMRGGGYRDDRRGHAVL